MEEPNKAPAPDGGDGGATTEPVETPTEGTTEAPQSGRQENESDADYASRLEKELAGLRNKDHNFSQANAKIKAKEREVEEARKAAEAAKTEAQRLADVEAQLQEYKTREQKNREAQYEAMVKQAASGDDVMEASIKEWYGKVDLPDDTPSEVAIRIAAAQALAENKRPAPNPINMAGSMGGAPYREAGKENFSNTSAGQELAVRLGFKEKPKK